MKKRIITIALAALALVSTGNLAMAGNPENCCKANTVKVEGKNGRERLGRYADLNLTPEQQEQMAALQQKYNQARAEKKKAIKAEKAAADSLKKIEREASRKEYLSEVKKILSPEQYDQYVKNMSVKAKKGGKKIAGKVIRDSENAYNKASKGVKNAYDKTASETKKLYNKTADGIKKVSGKVEKAGKKAVKYSGDEFKKGKKAFKEGTTKVKHFFENKESSNAKASTVL